MLVRARIILPIAAPPIEDGAVLVSGKRILKVGRWRDLNAAGGQTIDLGDVILMPGLINAHCHLDYTDMAGEIAPPKHFSDWIKSLLTLKSNWSYSEYATSWLNGAQMLLRSGTTTVADIEAVPELLPDVWTATPLRIRSFLEMTGVKSGRKPRDIVRDALAKISLLCSDRCSAGLSPHALYSTTPELIQHSAQVGKRKKLRLTTHVAESDEEFEMYVSRNGPLFKWLKPQRDMSDCGVKTPIEQLNHLGAFSENFLAVHVNYLGPNDAAILGKSGVSVVHCPRSHAYFKHRKFPLRQLLSAGVNVCLGTDSLVSVQKKRGRALALDMFAEMASLADAAPELSAEEIVRLATINGAKALGAEQTLGQLVERGLADLIAIPYRGSSTRTYDAIVSNTDGVAASMIDGQWAISPD